MPTASLTRSIATGGTTARTFADRAADVLNVKDFGAVGDGATDDTTALGAAFTAASGRTLFLPAGTYKVTSEISKAFANCRIYGVPGLTKITTSLRTGSNPNYQYPLLRLLTCTDVIFENIIFENSYTGADEDQGKAVVYSDGAVLTNLYFRNCTFTCPNANGNGLIFYLRTTAADADGSLDNVHVDQCVFRSIGRIACVVMNRFTGTGKYSFCRNFYFTDNIGEDLGTSGSYGFMLSLDGYGEKALVRGNLVLNALGIGIENTSFVNSDFIGNRFGDFQGGRAYSPFSFSGSNHGGAGSMTGLRVTDNETLDGQPANARCNFIDVSESHFARNRFEMVGDYCLHMRAGVNNRVDHDYYKSDNALVALIGTTGSTTTGHWFTGTTFNNASNASVSAVIRFDGSTTDLCKISRCVLTKGTGGTPVDRTNSAPSTAYEMSACSIDGLDYTGYRIINMTDADYFMQEWQAYGGVLRFSGTLTAARVVNMPDVQRSYLVKNSTTQTLTLNVGGFTTTVAAAASKITSFQKTSGTWFDFGTLT